MKKTFLILILSIAFQPSLWAQSDNDAVKQVDKELNDLIIQHNVTRADGYYLADFILTTSSGAKKLKADLLNEIGTPDLALEINETTDVTVRIVDATAVLTGTLHQKGQYKGKPFDVWLRVTDTWVNTNSGWKILAGHASIIPSTQNTSK